MSTMLEKAIIDAEALREVALKNAEAVVIEKYSNQIKEAVATLLEQPEDEELDLMATDVEEDPEVVDQLNVAATDDEDLCACPAEDEEFEVDFYELAKGTKKYEEEPEETHDQLAAGMLGEASEDVDEELVLNEQDLASIVEKMVVDISPEKSGWMGTSNAEFELAEEQLLAMLQDSERKEDLKATQKVAQDLQEANTKLEEANKNMQKEIALMQEKIDVSNEKIVKLVEAFETASTNLEETNTSNARLLYTNKILSNDSLNERQKNQIVEALAKSETVEEAKVIYETLQSAVGKSDQRKPMQSLSEAVNRTTSTMLLSRRQEAQSKDKTVDRWKILAGLNKATD